jgi:hypothetical protein
MKLLVSIETKELLCDNTGSGRGKSRGHGANGMIRDAIVTFL